MAYKCDYVYTQIYVHRHVYVCMDTHVTLIHTFYLGKMFGILMASCFFTTEWAEQ